MKEKEEIGSISLIDCTIKIDKYKKYKFHQLTAISNEGQEMSYIKFKMLGDYIWLLKIETYKDFQHKGYASKLMNILEYIGAKNEIKYIEGKYQPFNEFALPFYEKHEFEVPDLSDDCCDSSRLSKEIDKQKAQQNYEKLLENAINVNIEK